MFSCSPFSRKTNHQVEHLCNSELLSFGDPSKSKVRKKTQQTARARAHTSLRTQPQTWVDIKPHVKYVPSGRGPFSEIPRKELRARKRMHKRTGHRHRLSRPVERNCALTASAHSAPPYWWFGLVVWGSESGFLFRKPTQQLRVCLIRRKRRFPPESKLGPACLTCGCCRMSMAW